MFVQQGNLIPPPTAMRRGMKSLSEVHASAPVDLRQHAVSFPLSSALRSRVLPGCMCACLAIMLVLIVLPLPTQAASRYSVVAGPTVSAAFINRVLAAHHSPAAGRGLALFQDGIRYGIDPVFALAFFLHESKFGTVGIARVTRSLGNIRTPITSACRCRAYQGYRAYSFWGDGFVDWYNLILHLYVLQLHRVTLDQILPVYAPSADHNNVRAYITSVKRAVDYWRSGHI
jgi:hypothetical protein